MEDDGAPTPEDGVEDRTGNSVAGAYDGELCIPGAPAGDGFASGCFRHMAPPLWLIPRDRPGPGARQSSAVHEL